MTDQEPPTNDSQSNRIFAKIFQIIKQPRTQIITGVTVISLGIAGYVGVKILVTQIIPAEVEKRLSETLQREVEVGEISSFSLGHVTIEGTSISPTNEDKSYLKIDKINAKFRLFSIFINRTLPLDIVVNEVTGFAQLDTLLKSFEFPEEREPLKSLKLPPLPIISPDINLQLKQAELTVQMKSETKPLIINAQGNIDFLYDHQTQPLEYELQADLAEGKINIGGKTFLETGASNNQVVIENLDLPEVVALVDKIIPFTLNEGEVNANLQLGIASLEEINDFKIDGNLTVENLQAKFVNSEKIKILEKTLIADALLGFKGQKVTIEEAKATLGDLGGNVKGSLDLQTGFDLNLNLNPVSICKLLPQIPLELPLNAEGLITANFQVEGEILDPVIKGSIQSKKTIVDRVLLGDIQTNFQANLGELILEKLVVKPVAGGEFVATGIIETNLKETLVEKGKIDIRKMPLNFDFKTNLPISKVIAPYYNLPEEISIDKLLARGQIKGNLENPKASVQFEIPKPATSSARQISGKGELLLTDNKLSLTNTDLIVNQGKVTVDGIMDLNSKKWQANLVANQITLTPFLAQLCRASASCPYPQLNFNRPITLENTTIELNGKLDGIILTTTTNKKQKVEENLKNINHLAKKQNPLDVLGLDKIQGKVNFSLRLDGGTISVDSNVDNGQIQATVKARQILVQNFLPKFPLTTNLVTGNVNIKGAVDELLSIPEKVPSSFNIKADLKLAVDGGIVNATTNLNSETTEVFASVNQLDLEEIFPSTPVEAEGTQVNISANTKELFALARQPFEINNFATLNSLNADADLQLKVARGKVNANANLNSNLVKVTATTNNISAQDIIPDFPIETKNINAQMNIKADFPDLLAFGSNYLENQTVSNIPSLQLTTNANLEVAQGKLSLLANVDNNQWEANINTDAVNPEILAKQLSLLPKDKTLNIPNLNAKMDLAGNVNSLLQPNETIPIQAKLVKVDFGENSLSADGNLTITNLLTKPDVSNLQLNLNAKTNLASLPVNPILRQFNQNNLILPQEINLKGQAEFQGNIKGKNLLSNPLGKGNLALNGNINLANFSLNDLQFEPVLTGKITVIPTQEIALNLRGQNDVIAAKIVPGNLTIPNTDLTIPYVPDRIEISKDGQDRFIVEGRRENNQFVATVTNFPLELFNLAPGIEYGILGVIKGDVNADLALSLFDFTTTGQLNIKSPGIGNIQVTEIAADFSYQNNQAQLEKGSLKFGKTEYDFQGGLNFATGEINGKLNLQGNVDDIFTTIRISDFSTITAILQKIQNPESLGDANDVGLTSLGDENNSIEEKLNLLDKVDRQIKKIAKQIEAGTIPEELEIMGKYQGEVIVAGTIKSPQVNLNLEGNKWQWLPQNAFPNIVESLGLVMEETQAIPIPKVLIKGGFQDRQINIDTFNLNVGRSSIFFAGNLSTESQKGEFKVENFSVDLLENFVPLPVDLAGNININGKLDGNLNDPQIKGNLEVSDFALEGEILEKTIAGNFDYSDRTLNFNTTFPEEIKVAATIPYYPFVKTTNPAKINVSLDTEAIALLGLLTQGQIELSGGEAQANINIEIASLNNLISNLSKKNIPVDRVIDEIKLTGDVILDNAEVTSVALVNPVNVTGKATLLNEQKAIKIEQIDATIEGAEINIAGVLPLLKPINNNQNPLQVKIKEQNVELEGLYRGNMAGDIQIIGTALTPEIGGNVYIGNGTFDLPSRPGIQKIRNIGAWQKWLGEVSKTTAGIFQPKLNNFEIQLESVELEQWRLYRFLFGGNLAINGNLLDFGNLQADGAVNFQRGEIYLGGSEIAGGTGQTTFYLSRANENQIIFDPKDSILNPKIDLQVEADIIDYSRQLPETQRNEIPEPIIRGARGETIRVNIFIDGKAQQLLPDLAGDVTQFCKIPSDRPIADDVQLSTEQLQQMAQCVKIGSLQEKGSNLGILDSPVITLSSVPNRSTGELINLIIGGQLINLASQLQNLSGEQLFEIGFVQFLLEPLINNVSFTVNDAVSTWGEPVGMKDVRIFPVVEGVYELQEKTNLTVTYDYIYSEFRIRYQMRF
jgi:hypothetical protein